MNITNEDYDDCALIESFNERYETIFSDGVNLDVIDGNDLGVQLMLTVMPEKNELFCEYYSTCGIPLGIDEIEGSFSDIGHLGVFLLTKTENLILQLSGEYLQQGREAVKDDYPSYASGEKTCYFEVTLDKKSTH